MPRGGRRPGAGRKPKNTALRMIDGGASKRAAAPSPNAEQVIEGVEEFGCPDYLTEDEREIWNRQAPFAFKNRTLVPATAMAFETLCRNVALEREIARDPDARGTAKHKGMIQAVSADFLAFNLKPCGKPVVSASAPAAKPANPLDRFLRKAK